MQVLDEADEMLNRGFAEDVEKLMVGMPQVRREEGGGAQGRERGGAGEGHARGDGRALAVAAAGEPPPATRPPTQPMCGRGGLGNWTSADWAKRMACACWGRWG